MNITNGLLLFTLFILLKQFYSGVAAFLVTVGIGALGYWLATEFPARWKEHRAERRQREQDEKEYWDYDKKHKAIRAKYDPRHEWDEATSVPREYLEEIEQLQQSYRNVLARRRGAD